MSDEQRLVVPGELIAKKTEKLKINPRSYMYIHIVGDKIYAAVPAVVILREDELNVIPLESTYVPKQGDLVIGLVRTYMISHWELDINSPYPGILHASNVLGRPFIPGKDELKDYLDIGDYVLAKVESFNRLKDPVLTVRGDKKLGRITRGKIIEIEPSRIPKVVGRKGSMLNIIKGDTGCEVEVAANGRIWVSCPNEELEDIVTLAIKLIEKEAFTAKLAEKVRVLIADEKHERGLI
ncbi:RNA-binding protein [Ignicoccus islandicus DSM 13165]|uniref:Exosome complex component Rrp4 n=1 Tax=Ignicoccus islandicus DSM 13165 TaxID=940295 RepID=A0A0U3G0H3_9CREN|nr:exosome complex RNA-binding protein Rrp4 [Ignicoccus islandicus]ALU11820.1 RNA-binding protein [Ignicoccus islandicus DSM 13165]